MRVLVISEYLDVQAVRPEAELMIRLAQLGIELDIITHPGSTYESRFKSAGITVHLTHPTKKFDHKYVQYLISLSRKNNYEIFYLFNSKAIINGIRAAKHLPVKVLLYRGYTGNINWYDPSAYFKYLHPRVDKIICLAQSIKDYLGRQLFFDSDKAITINKGHDPLWYQNITPIDLKEFGIPPDGFVVACMGNARTFKGIKYLLQATVELGDLSNLHLLLVGRDMAKGNLKKLINESPIKDRIIATGWRQDVLSILASVPVFVLPSIGGEATTKSLIEAMSMGCAPIITDIAGNRGMVEDGETGIVIPRKNPIAIANAIKEYHADAHLVSTYGKKSKAYIAKYFHIDRTVSETLQLMRELVD